MTITPLFYHEIFWVGKTLGISRCCPESTYLLLKVSFKSIRKAEERERKRERDGGDCSA